MTDEQSEQGQGPPDQPAEPVPAPEPVQLTAQQPVPSPAPSSSTNTLVIVGWILVALGFVCCCCGPLFSIPGIICGIVAYSRGDQRGLPIIIVGAIVLVLGGGAGTVAGVRGWSPWTPYFRQHPWPMMPPGRPV